MFYSFEDFFPIPKLIVALRNKIIPWWLEVDWGRRKEQNWTRAICICHRKHLIGIPRTSVCYLKAAQSKSNSLSVISRRQPCAWYFIRLVPSLLKLQTISVCQSWGAVWWKSLLFLNIHVIPSPKAVHQEGKSLPRRLVTSFQRASSLSALQAHNFSCITFPLMAPGNNL